MASLGVTIGLPVYNGEKRGLKRALEGILAQTYGDFVLVVSDNGSTDATKDIVLSYQKTDKRVLYLPSPVNVGAIENFKRCLYVATTPYFMWAADDDTHDPSYIEKLLKAHTEETVLTHSLVQRGKDVAEHLLLDQDHAAFRFLKCFAELPNCNPFYGLWRTAVARLLNWQDLLWGFDFVALCEATLYGKFGLVPEVLFHLKENTALWSKPVQEHIKHYAGMMDTRKSGLLGGVMRDGRGLTMPITEKVAAVFQVLNYSTLPEKEDLLPMLLAASERYKGAMQFEVDRVREKVEAGRLADGWLLDAEVGGEGRKWHARKLLQRLEDAEFLGLEVADLKEACRGLAVGQRPG